MDMANLSRRPRLRQKRDRFWLTVGLCALTAALIFLPFQIIDGGFFHYAGDFNGQQIGFYRYMNGFVKGQGYPDGLASAGGQRLPSNTFSWATDLGSGVMNAYSFYLYGSPFFWLSTLFPQSWMPYLMCPLLVLKFAVAGGGAYLYMRRYVKHLDYAVLAACLYTFSGFGIYNIFFNHFIDVVALFPWMLWALDECIYSGRRGLFAFFVAVNLLNNYFFFVGQVVFLIIYFACKVSAGEIRLTRGLFGTLAWESLLGVALGCLLVWPAFLSLLQNPRTTDISSGWGFLTYSKVQQYLAILVSWFMPPDSPYIVSIWSEGTIKWTSMTAYLPLCSLAGAVAYWRSRQGDGSKRIIAVCALFALVPVLNSAFYAFNASYYARWYYMPVLILAAMTVKAWEDPDTDLERGGLADDRHPGLCPGAGERWGELVPGRDRKPGAVPGGAGLRAGGADPLPRHCPLSGGPEDLLPPDAGGGAGFQLRVRHRAHRHRQIWPVELRQRPGGTVPGVHRPWACGWTRAACSSLTARWPPAF